MARQPPKCCCCVPLRPGLLAWAYIKLVLALTYIGTSVYVTTQNMPYYVRRTNDFSQDSSPVVFILEQLWPLAASLLYLVFSILFAIGMHRQSSKLLLVFLVYSMLEVILAGAAVGWLVHDFVLYFSYYRRLLQNRSLILVYFRLIFPIVVNMLLPIYFSGLIKSEVQRLKTARRETRVVLDKPVTKEQDKTYNLGYSNETPVRGKPLFPVEELEGLRQELGVKNV